MRFTLRSCFSSHVCVCALVLALALVLAAQLRRNEHTTTTQICIYSPHTHAQRDRQSERERAPAQRPKHSPLSMRASAKIIKNNNNTAESQNKTFYNLRARFRLRRKFVSFVGFKRNRRNVRRKFQYDNNTHTHTTALVTCMCVYKNFSA